jgi:hypothetical protein
MVAEPKPKPEPTPPTLPDRELIETLSKFGNSELLDLFAEFAAKQEEWTTKMNYVEYLLHQRMIANKTKTIDHHKVSCQMGTPTTYPDMLMALRETVGEERWNKGFTPAHKETKEVDVPDKFDMRVVNGWKALGDHVTGVIEHATDPHSAKLTLKLKKK